MSSVNASCTLAEICFPDITGKVIRAWGAVSVAAGSYVAGGIDMGLIAFADARTVDFNGFLRCDVFGEDEVSGSLYLYHYVPSTDKLQIFDNATGQELVDGDPVPAAIVADTLLFEASFDRTTVRG